MCLPRHAPWLTLISNSTLNFNLIVHIMPVNPYFVIKIARVLYRKACDSCTIANKRARSDRFPHITDYKKPARKWSCQPSSVHCVVPFTWSSVLMYSSLMLHKKYQLLKVRLSITLHMHDLCIFFRKGFGTVCCLWWAGESEVSLVLWTIGEQEGDGRTEEWPAVLEKWDFEYLEELSDPKRE